MSRRAFLVVALLFGLLPASVRAHSPHDLAMLLELSPDFANDQTAFAIFKLSEHWVFGRSVDGGRSWQVYGTEMSAYRVVGLRFSPEYASDGTAYAATQAKGLWRTVDRGASWARVDVSGFPTSVNAFDVSPHFAVDQGLIVVSHQGCHRSNDGGQTWFPSGSGISEAQPTVVAYLPGLNGQGLVAGRNVLHRSLDGAHTWTAICNLGGEMSSLGVSPDYVTDLTLEVGLKDDGVALSTNGGSSFLRHGNGLADLEVNDVRVAAGGRVFAATHTGIYRADAPGLPWTQVASGLEVLSDLTDDHYQFVVPSPTCDQDGIVFAGGFEGVFVTDDAGTLWRQRDIYGQRVNRTVLFSPTWAQDRTLFFANHGGGLMVLEPATNAGAATLGGSFGGGGLLPTTGGGSSPGRSLAGLPSHQPPAPWTKQLPTHWDVRALGTSSLHLRPLALAPDFPADPTVFTGHLQLYRSQNAGQTWTTLTFPPGVLVVRSVGLSPDYATDQTLFFGTSGEGLYRSTTRGDTWQEIGLDLAPDFWAREIRVSPDFTRDDTLYIASDTGLWVSRDRGDSWELLDGGLGQPGVRSLELSPDFTSDRTIFAGTVEQGVFISTDAGLSWAPANNGLVLDGAGIDIEGLGVSPGWSHDRTLFVSTRPFGVYRSIDGGQSWQPASSGLDLTSLRDLAVSPDFGHDRTLVVDSFDWSWISTDAGASWKRLSARLRVDDGSDQVRYDGAWMVTASLQAHGKNRHGSKVVGAGTEHEFYGRSVGFHGGLGPTLGIANIYVDDQLVASVDAYAPSPVVSTRLWSMDFEQPGWHVVRVEVSGSHNPSSFDVWVVSDGFEVAFDDWPLP